MSNLQSRIRPCLLSICFIIAHSYSFKAISSGGIEDYTNPYSHNVYGGVGLIEMPTARFSVDGEFGFGLSSDEPETRLYGKMQFFPWLEAVLRYTEGTFISYLPGSQQTWKDKGVDLKLRLFQENEYMPQVAVGFTDIGGTGYYSGEYLVATKAYNNLDFTLGMGWGRFGGLNHVSNPIAWFDANREVRGGFDPRGGTFNFTRFFSGDRASFFGGIEYFSEIPNLSFKLEYDSSDYSDVIGREKVFYESGDIFELDSRFNYALNYRLYLGDRDNVDFSIGYVRGNTLYANFSIHSNLNFKGAPKDIIGPEKIRNTNLHANSFAELTQNRKDFLTNRIIKEMASNGFVTHKIIFNDDELAAEISQGRFQETTKFLDLASRILANNALPNIKTITVINVDQGIETLRSSINRDELIEAVSIGPLSEDLMEFNQIAQVKSNSQIIRNEHLYPNFYWELKPLMTGTLQHQIKFYFWQLQALLSTQLSITKGLYLMTDVGLDIANNFEDYTWHVPDGQLYHVRQDRRLYLTEGESGLRKMALEYLFDISSNVTGKMTAGYLEWMYGGIGGEVLYMPDSKHWGLGLDLYWLKQREFDQKFSFKDYETVTGHLTYYQDIPFYDMRLKLSFGRFLAKDIGAHIDISRRFDTGARVGAIVAITDCDSECVGEGSFNKWIYFELPMDIFYSRSSTRSKTGYYWSPLTKDAAQKVEDGRLYGLMINATDEVGTLRKKSWSIKKIISGFSTKPSQKI